jgi:hypothetical protein
MIDPVFLTRVVLRNYKSIGYCDVRLNPLTYLVGANGSGKSNFLDALHLVRDALAGSLDNALSERGGLNEVRRRSSAHPTNFGIRLEFALSNGPAGHYAFNIGALAGRGYEVQFEECVLGGGRQGSVLPYRARQPQSQQRGDLSSGNRRSSGVGGGVGNGGVSPGIRCLDGDGFLQPESEVDARVAEATGGALAQARGGEHRERDRASGTGPPPTGWRSSRSIFRRLRRWFTASSASRSGRWKTLEFRQDMAGAKHPWRFPAQNMSDGTLRALGVLTALFQGNRDYAPSLVGIEEPETARHPAASAALREALARASQDTPGHRYQSQPGPARRSVLECRRLAGGGFRGRRDAHCAVGRSRADGDARPAFFGRRTLRLNQLAPDRAVLDAQEQADLFGEVTP